MPSFYTHDLKQRLAYRPLAVACLCMIGLSACASDEKAISWQQDKPQIYAGIEAVQHEQQVSADQLRQQKEAFELLQQKVEALEQINTQQIAALDTLSQHVEELHRSKKSTATTQAPEAAKPVAKVKVNHPAPIATPTPKLPPIVAAPAAPKVDQAAIDEAEKNTYTAAYLALKSGRFEEASQAFNKQLDLYPTGQYSDQAWYWLGETRLAQGDNSKALNAFKYVADHYNRSVKHAAALLKLGQLTQHDKQYANARSYYQRLIQKHPDSNLAEQARAALSSLPDGSGNASESQP